MPKLLCLVCMTEETVPAVGHGPGVPSKDGSQLVSADGDSKHDPISIPYHCGKQMKYFEDENADKYRVCPD